MKMNIKNLFNKSLSLRFFGSRTENPGFPKELLFKAKRLDYDPEAAFRDKRKLKARNYLINNIDGRPMSLFSINQTMLFEHFDLMDTLILREKREAAKQNLLAMATGYKDAEKNLKKHKKYTIADFQACKKAILEARPHLKKYDSESFLQSANEEERIEFFKERLNKKFPWNEYDTYNTPDNGDKIMILIQDIRDQAKSPTPGWEEEISEVIENENVKIDNELIQKVQKHFKHSNPEYFSNNQIKDEELIMIVERLNSEIDYLEAYYKNNVYFHEEKLAVFRFHSEVDYMVRGDLGVEYHDTIHRHRESEQILKHFVELSYRPDFKKLISSYSKSLDNKRVDIGLIINRPPIFLYVPKNEIEYAMYKNSFLNKFGVNISSLMEDLDAHNTTPNEIWKLPEKVYNDDPNNEPVIRKRRSKKEITPLELRTSSETNYEYLNSYMLRDNSPDDPFNVYCLNSKHYLRVDPTIKDPKNLQTDSCWNVYFICRNKISGRWEFPTKSVMEGISMKETSQWLLYDLTRKGFDVYVPREFRPLSMVTRNFFDYEKEDEKNEDLTGVRTYYYTAYHDIGEPCVYVNDLHPYDDWLMVKKDDLHKYFDKSYYESIVKFLH